MASLINVPQINERKMKYGLCAFDQEMSDFWMWRNADRATRQIFASQPEISRHHFRGLGVSCVLAPRKSWDFRALFACRWTDVCDNPHQHDDFSRRERDEAVSIESHDALSIAELIRKSLLKRPQHRSQEAWWNIKAAISGIFVAYIIFCFISSKPRRLI